jgi:cyclohexanone monooxygenase
MVSSSSPARVDVIVVGAGFAGLYAIHRLRQQGFAVQGFEAGAGVGGTWYWNRYPGARCDVESVEYSYSFSRELEREWVWTERYASQPEILRYLQHVAARFDLARHFKFGARVIAAVFDEAIGVWNVTTDQGEQHRARFLIMATGCLSEARLPAIVGLSDFSGSVLQTSRWPAEGVDLAGHHVGIIGTGSTGIQCIPQIAKEAAFLTVFQRTPNFSVPAGNGPLDAATRSRVIENYPAIRETQRTSFSSFAIGDGPPISALQETVEQRDKRYREAWARGGISFLFSYNDLIVNRIANATAAEFVRARIRETVLDPGTAARLVPPDYPIGSKRLCLDTEYFATFNRSNVDLVDLRATPIQRCTHDAVVTTDREYKIDTLVFATGFDAVTGALLAMDIHGRGGRSLQSHWQEGPRMYLGLMASGFPNLFAITGPGSPSVLSNMVVSIEQHVDFALQLIAAAKARGADCLEADWQAESDWVKHVSDVAHTTLYPEANSWYMGANMPGKQRVFLPYVGGVGPYRKHCEAVAAADYRGFHFR